MKIKKFMFFINYLKCYISAEMLNHYADLLVVEEELKELKTYWHGKLEPYIHGQLVENTESPFEGRAQVHYLVMIVLRKNGRADAVTWAKYIRSCRYSLATESAIDN